MLNIVAIDGAERIRQAIARAWTRTTCTHTHSSTMGMAASTGMANHELDVINLILQFRPGVNIHNEKNVVVRARF